MQKRVGGGFGIEIVLGWPEKKRNALVAGHNCRHLELSRECLSGS